MELVRALRDYLRDGLDIQDRLADSNYGTKVFAGRVPQGVDYPAVTLRLLSGNPNDALVDEQSLARAIVEVEGYAYKEPEAWDVMELIRLRPLSHVRGYVGIENHGRTWIDSCVEETESLIMDIPRKGTDQWIYRGSASYSIFYKRTRPISGD